MPEAVFPPRQSHNYNNDSLYYPERSVHCLVGSVLDIHSTVKCIGYGKEETVGVIAPKDADLAVPIDGKAGYEGEEYGEEQKGGNYFFQLCYLPNQVDSVSREDSTGVSVASGAW